MKACQSPQSPRTLLAPTLRIHPPTEEERLVEEMEEATAEEPTVAATVVEATEGATAVGPGPWP